MSIERVVLHTVTDKQVLVSIRSRIRKQVLISGSVLKIGKNSQPGMMCPCQLA